MPRISQQPFKAVQRRARASGKAPYYRLHRHRYAAIVRALAALRLPRGAHLLEVGVTPGQCTELLVRSGYRVSGVDLDPHARQALWHELGVQVCQMHLERDPLPFSAATFQAVVFSEVIEHLVYSPLPLLRDFRRVLVPGGSLLITTPNDLYLKSRLRALVRLLRWQSLETDCEFRHQIVLEGDARYTTHSRLYTMRQLCWLLQQAGFQPVQQHYVAAWERVGLEAHRLLRQPAGVLGKAALSAVTAALPATRSMLLVVAQSSATS